MVLGFQESDFAYNFLSIFIEGAPFILLGTLISGFIDVYMPTSAMDRLLPKKRFPAILVSGLLGLILPVCECAIVPVIRRLVAKGLPVSCAFTYMLAAPIVNPITIWSTYHAFGGDAGAWETVWTRIGMGYLIAVVVGLIVMFVPIERVLRESILKTIRSSGEKIQLRRKVLQLDEENGEKATSDFDMLQSLPEVKKEAEEQESKVVTAFRSGMRDCVDVAVYFTIGVCLTAMFNILYVNNMESFDAVLKHPSAEIGGAMFLAFILSVCSTSDAFMAATLNIGNSAKMAFMVLGPMLDMKLLFLYQTVMKKKFLLWLSIGLFVGIGLICFFWGEAVKMGKI